MKLNEDKTAGKSRVETAQALVSQCTELQTEEGLSHRALFSGDSTPQEYIIASGVTLTVIHFSSLFASPYNPLSLSSLSPSARRARAPCAAGLGSPTLLMLESRSNFMRYL